MKKLIIAAVLALAAAQAEARPVSPLTGWYQGSWTCTIAHSPKQKLFMTLGSRSARAAVREYPYYGQTEYKTLRLASGRSLSRVSFMGRNGRLSLIRSATPGVLTGSGRIGTTLMLLTCSKS
jgi:hypothetical protein